MDYRRISLLVCSMGLLGLLPTNFAFASGCANEALRSELASSLLPDCRAYELVSPATKYGWPIEVRSANGMHVIINSLGSFAGNNQTTVLNYYDLERGNSGWVTTPFSLPKEFNNLVGTNLLDESQDSSEGIFALGRATPSEQLPYEYTLYEHQLPVGAFEELGPIVPQAAARQANRSPGPEPTLPSASDDLSRVLFALRGPAGFESSLHDYLWPGDGTVQNTGPLYNEQGFFSLYEYRRGSTSHAPVLVGVDNEGRQVSQCGTALGLPALGEANGHKGRFGSVRGEETYNAITTNRATGTSRVFYTAAAATEGVSQNACTDTGVGRGPSVNELWARTDESDSTAISEPSLADCVRCDTSASEQREALFQGASEDGSKVLFLSEQKLLPGAGAENLYQYDFNGPAGGRVVLVAPDALGVARLSEDGSHVYFCSEAVLTGANLEGRTPATGAPNLYVDEDGHTAFIATLADADAQDWLTEDSRPLDATPDGRFLVFTSVARLTPGDTGGIAQVFKYDAQLRTLVRVSSGPLGDGSQEFPASIAYPRYSGVQDPGPQLTSISDDGSRVVFQSDAALTPEAALGYPNVYEYDSGGLSLISDGQDRSRKGAGLPSSELVGMDGSGNDIFFETADQLVPQDGDTQIDLYDAREDGGFPPSTTPGACEGEGCQGPLAPAPVFTPVASTGQAPDENVVESKSSIASKKAKPKVTKHKVTKHKVKTRRRSRAAARSRRVHGSARGAGVTRGPRR